MNPAATSEATVALAQRLAVVRDVLGLGAHDGATDGSLFTSLVELVSLVRDKRDPAMAWLLVVALAGAMPDPALARAVSRTLALDEEPEDSVLWLLNAVEPLARSEGNAGATLRVVSDRPLVDVNLTAKADFITGIQRVVRSLAAQWADHHDVEFVVWTERGGAYRPLNDVERSRLLQRPAEAFEASSTTPPSDTPEIIVPWGVPVVILEVPAEPLSDRLAAMAELTANSVRLVGHDCIPMSSAETVPLAEPEKFGRYLELVKHADRLAGVSRSAAAEFAGFTRALSAQGLSGPAIVACPLAHSEGVAGESEESPSSERPLVLSIGSVGRRKNQVALVEAAEMLWREGLDFELRILGHLGRERTPLIGLVPELEALGRPIVHEPAVSDSRIATSLAQARCLVFPTLHEGFGLPVAEALSHGVPVITSDFGSTREIAEGKGGLVVDPEDVEALADALRVLIADDDLHARLVAEADARPPRTWKDYADDLWEALVA